MSGFHAHVRRRLMRGSYSNEEIKGDFRCGLAMESTLRNCSFRDTRLDGMNFSGSRFLNCLFETCTLNGAVLSACTFENCEFIGCEMDLARFDASTFRKCRFDGGRAEYSSWVDATVENTVFNLQLHEADLRFGGTLNVDYGDSNLWGAGITVSCAQFRGNRFSDRQVDIFLRLVAQAAGQEKRAQIETIIHPKYRELTEKLLMLEAKDADCD